MHIILSALFYFCGIFLAASFNLYSLLFFAGVLFFCWRQKYFRWFLPVFFVLGLVLTLHQQNGLAAKLLSAENWRPEQITLRIVSDVRQRDDAVTFTARSGDYKIMVRIRNGKDLRYGDELTLTRFRLFPLRIKRNFFITGYDDFLYSRGYSLRLNANAPDIAGKESRNSLFRTAIDYKNKFANIQRQTLPPKQAEMMCTLLFGAASSAIDSETRDEYRRAGIVHLLTVSGMHLAILLALLQKLAAGLRLRRWPAFWLISFINVLFVFSVGAGASVLRAGLMAQLVLFANAVERKTDSYNTLALSALILALFNPLVAFDIGFQFSCAAVLALVFLVPILEDRLKFLPKFFRGLLAVSLAPLLLTMPLSIYYFQGVSLGALFLNILVLPWVSLIVTLGFVASLLGVVFLPAATLINAVNYVLLNLLDWLAGIFAHSYIDLPQIPLALLFLSMAWPLVFALRPKELGKYTLILGVFILCWLVYPGPNALRIIFLDIGQGESIVLTRRKKALVIDCGADSARTAGDTLRMTLLKLGVSSPDVLLTHAHADHYNGLPSLPKINALVLPENTPERLAEVLRSKANFVTDELDWVRLYQSERNYSNENNNSRLALLEQGNFRALFTGDAETAAEKLFLNVLPEIDLLKAGHHGSRTSSTKEFLAVLKPDNTVISVGAGNRYRHPNADALNRIAVWSNIWRTDEHGAVMVTVYPRHYNLVTTRSGRQEKFPIRTKSW